MIRETDSVQWKWCIGNPPCHGMWTSVVGIRSMRLKGPATRDISFDCDCLLASCCGCRGLRLSPPTQLREVETAFNQHWAHIIVQTASREAVLTSWKYLIGNAPSLISELDGTELELGQCNHSRVKWSSTGFIFVSLGFTEFPLHLYILDESFFLFISLCHVWVYKAYTRFAVRFIINNTCSLPCFSMGMRLACLVLKGWREVINGVPQCSVLWCGVLSYVSYTMDVINRCSIFFTSNIKILRGA